MRSQKFILVLVLIVLLIPIWTGGASADPKIFVSKVSVDKSTIPYSDCVNLTITVTNTHLTEQRAKGTTYIDNAYYRAFELDVPANGNANKTIRWCPTKDDIGKRILKATVEESSALIDVTYIGPDIVIHAFSVDKQIVEPGEFLRFTIMIENREPSLHPSFYGTIYRGGIKVMEVGFTVDYGETITNRYSLEIDDDHFPGAYQFTLVVFDKTASIDISIMGVSHLEMNYIRVDETAEAGDTVTIVISVSNRRGTADAHNVSVELSMDGDLIEILIFNKVPAGKHEEVIYQWKIPEDTAQGEHGFTARLIGCDGYECNAWAEIFIINPLGGTPPYYYIIGFALGGVIMAMALMLVLRSGKGGRAKSKKVPEDDDDVIILED